MWGAQGEGERDQARLGKVDWAGTGRDGWGLTMAQQNFPQATLALSEYSEIDTFWSMIPSAKLSSLR